MNRSAVRKREHEAARLAAANLRPAPSKIVVAIAPSRVRLASAALRAAIADRKHEWLNVALLALRNPQRLTASMMQLSTRKGLRDTPGTRLFRRAVGI